MGQKLGGLQQRRGVVAWHRMAVAAAAIGPYARLREWEWEWEYEWARQRVHRVGPAYIHRLKITVAKVHTTDKRIQGIS
jgi:hypothetical protein